MGQSAPSLLIGGGISVRIAVFEDSDIPPHAVRVYRLHKAQTLPRRLRFGGKTVWVDAAPMSGQWPSRSKHMDAEIGLACGHSVMSTLSLPIRVLSVLVHGDTWILGPCLALYASQYDNPIRMFGEQTRLFEDLTQMSENVGVDVVVLTPSSYQGGQAWRYVVKEARWVSTVMEEPDLVIRRSGTFPNAVARQVTMDMRRFQKKNVLHTLPRECSNKWRLYETLRRDSALKHYLPHTVLAETGRQVYNQILERKDVYVKPIGGAQGVSVFRLKAASGAVLASWEKRNLSRATERLNAIFEPDTTLCAESFSSYLQFEQFWKKTRLKRCIVQDTIRLPRIQDNCPFDFRWLIQSSDAPQVIARVARIGQPNAVTTNLHTGGRAMSAETLLDQAKYIQSEQLLQQMDHVALLVTRRLAISYGHFAELGIDLALTPDRKIFVFEVNPTPGRRMLRSLSDNVRELSLETLLEYASRATGFSGE